MQTFKFVQSVAFAGLIALSVPSPAEASTWDLDISHSDIGFSVRHMTVSNTRGHFTRASGVVELDDADLAKSKITIEIDASSIDTDHTKRDEHLRSPDFFDTAKYPKIIFRSKSIKKSGSGYAVFGDLTIRGVTKPVTLAVTTLTAPVKDMQGKQVRGVVATTKIMRKDFGLTYGAVLDTGGLAIGEEVTITIEAELRQRVQKQ